MGVTVAFCDRFKVEELGPRECLRRNKLHHGVGCGAMEFEYGSQPPNVRFAGPGWGRQRSGSNLMLAQIGEPLKGLEFLEGIGDAAQDMVKRFFGLGKRRLGVEVSSWSPAKGETIAVLVSLHPHGGFLHEIFHFFRKNAYLDAAVQVMYDGCGVPVFPTASDSKLWRALVPTTPLTTPGPRALKVVVNDSQHEIFEGTVEVTEKEYPVEYIWLPKTKSKIRGTAMEKKKVGAFIATVSANQIWNGPFILPSDGEITTDYGMQRYYDGVFAKHYYHRGVDYGAWEGDPVKAPANGRVALVGYEKDGYEIHGNCVGLDHGHGVTSIMMHLNSSFVKEGEMVQAGQVIGTVGDTGMATGPHLHWGLHVRGEAVDPQPWMQAQKWI